MPVVTGPDDRPNYTTSAREAGNPRWGTPRWLCVGRSSPVGDAGGVVPPGFEPGMDGAPKAPAFGQLCYGTAPCWRVVPRRFELRSRRPDRRRIGRTTTGDCCRVVGFECTCGSSCIRHARATRNRRSSGHGDRDGREVSWESTSADPLVGCCRVSRRRSGPSRGRRPARVSQPRKGIPV